MNLKQLKKLNDKEMRAVQMAIISGISVHIWKWKK